MAHQRRAQEVGALAALEAVERLVVEWQFAADEFDERLVAAAFAEPAQDALRLRVLQEPIEIGTQRRDGRRIAAAGQLIEAPAHGAAHAETGEVVDLLGAAALADLAHLLAGAALADRRVDQRGPTLVPAGGAADLRAQVRPPARLAEGADRGARLDRLHLAAARGC